MDGDSGSRECEQFDKIEGIGGIVVAGTQDIEKGEERVVGAMGEN